MTTGPRRPILRRLLQTKIAGWTKLERIERKIFNRHHFMENLAIAGDSLALTRLSILSAVFISPFL